MHISHRVDVTSVLSSAQDNVIELQFKNAPAFAKKEKDRIGYKGNGTDVHFGSSSSEKYILPPPITYSISYCKSLPSLTRFIFSHPPTPIQKNRRIKKEDPGRMHANEGETGGAERLFVRKAQYHWGWDWGPAINTSGPWRPIYLETFRSRISEFLVRQNVSPDLSSATISITGSLDAPSKAAIVIVVEDPDGKKVLVKNAEQVEIEVDKQGQFKGSITLDRDLRLWYPFTYGSSPLYTVTAYLAGQDSVSRKLGLRRLRLLQHELKNAPGTSFTFEVNNVPIFAGGSCWIPGDFMLPRFTREKYEEWLLLAKSGNQCMVNYFTLPLRFRFLTLIPARPRNLLLIERADPCLGRGHRRVR
jgi:hypothetical protein